MDYKTAGYDGYAIIVQIKFRKYFDVRWRVVIGVVPAICDLIIVANWQSDLLRDEEDRKRT